MVEGASGGPSVPPVEDPSSASPVPASTKVQRTLDDFGGSASVPAVTPGAHPPPPPLPEGTFLEGLEGEFVEHPLLRSSKLRAYPFQVAIARAALQEDVMVVLPTGLGKTVIAALVAAERLRCGRGKVLFLSPTRPLVQQHARSFASWFRSLPRATFTGTVDSPKREGSWGPSDAIFATPQLIVNDLESGAYSLRDVGLLVFDEAHRAVGKYAYVRIAAIYRSQRPDGRRVLGLTASPGGKGAKIDEVLGALGVSRVEARSREDADVAEYVQAVSTEHVRVKLPPEVDAVRQELRGGAHEAMVRLQRMGFLRNKPLRVTGVKDLVATRGMIMARPGPMGRKFGALYQLMLAMHFYHAGELLETQGLAPFLDYVGRVQGKEKQGKADKAFLAHPAISKARSVAEGREGSPGSSSHPKLEELGNLVEETLRSNPSAKVLVFAQYRDTVRSIVRALQERKVVAKRFVGQATRSSEDRGMDQREQTRLVEEFRQGRFPVLVASSVAEEGLDIPNVDLVVFFEALPSEIRTIQRRGRTGRNAAGRVVVLMAQGTRDEGYHRAERKRENAMLRHVRRFAADGQVRGGSRGVADEPAEGRTKRRKRSSEGSSEAASAPGPDAAP